MKINKWTVGLAAVGLVSLASVAQAEEKTTPILTALSSTSISGYVDVSMQWNPGTGTVGPAFKYAGGKRDGFNVDSILVTLEKPLEEGEWSAGYRIDLMYGPDAVIATGDAGNPNVRQAYVALRAPVGNGLDFKLGRWDSIIGYESTDAYKNPNFTRSYGHTLGPAEHTGLLATYQALDWLSLNAGIANTEVTGPLNLRSGRAESHKTYMASVAITAPDSWGFLSGSAFYAGIVDGFGGSLTADSTDFYAGATFATPIEGLRFGLAYNFFDDPIGKGTDSYTAAGYVSFKAMEKLGLHLRGEYAHGVAIPGTLSAKPEILAVTATVQYDIWENVLSRLEVRWDHDASGSPFRPWGAGGGKRNDFLVAANLIYKF
jgi:hypothetical protein